MIRLLLPLLAAAITCSGPLSAAEKKLDAQVAQATLVKAGQGAPDFTGRATDGRSFTLSALRGKVVVLYFFSASVGASLTEMRYLETEVFQKLAARDDFQLIAIGRGHTREELVRAGGENRLTFPLVADPQAEVFGLYFTKFVPRTVVVRRDGTIASLASGYHEFDGIVKLQETLARELTTPAR